jgi:4-diphosphocytidyl-2-C-methyl-D-erythritol kinase
MRALFDIPAPAKLNLFLHITGRRPDGYHLLQSAFMLIDWCDRLHFETRHDGQITRRDIGAALPAEDLVVRAARALQQRTGCALGAEITLEKRIPTQAGLGGGSSDAASTLLALNRLWGLNLPLAALMRIGLDLGADVPFFLGGRHAWVEGIGEVLQPISLEAERFVVVKPRGGLSTASVFGSESLKRDFFPATIAVFADDPYRYGCNALQDVAVGQCPEIARAIEWLQSLGLAARMTGSGSAVFAPLGAIEAVPEPPEPWEVKICKNLVAHPLLGWAASDD